MDDKIDMALRRFGDGHHGEREEVEESRLMDRYERMSFEMQLNKAIHLSRCLSSPSPLFVSAAAPPPPDHLLSQDARHRRRKSTSSSSSTHRRRLGITLNFNKVLKKLLKPILVIGTTRNNKKKKSSSTQEEAEATSPDHTRAAPKDLQQHHHLRPISASHWTKFTSSRSLRL